MRILPDSPLVGRRLEQLELRKEGINILGIERRARFDTDIIRPDGSTDLRAGDLVLIDVRSGQERSQQLREQLRVEVLPLEESDYFFDRTQQIGMVEAIVPPDSPLIGSTVLEARIRAEHRLTVIGLRHGRTAVGSDLLEEKLRAGDTLLLTGFWSDIGKQQADSHGLVVLNLPAEHADVLPAAGRAP